MRKRKKVARLTKAQKLDAEYQACNQLRRLVMEAIGHCTIGDTDRATDCLDELRCLIDADTRSAGERYA